MEDYSQASVRSDKWKQRETSELRMLRSLLFRWLSQRRGTETRVEAGERLAEAYLRRKSGFKPVARNWRNPRDRREEIDLVMKGKNYVNPKIGKNTKIAKKLSTSLKIHQNR